ncbi:MAG: hypothetical protein IH877_08505, partial [Gemmatimonadetes bacterium]|nr:hypothetical protein [Gemmatimonadota bacterium]
MIKLKTLLSELTRQAVDLERESHNMQQWKQYWFRMRQPLRQAIFKWRQEGILVDDQYEDVVSLLEKMDEEQLRATRRALPGIFLNREEILQAVPDPESFLEFAVKWGDRADIAFFSTLQMSYSSPGWPLYIIPLTDYGGCRRLGSFVFSEIYGRWRAFQSRFPNRYKEQVRREINRLEENIL